MIDTTLDNRSEARRMRLREAQAEWRARQMALEDAFAQFLAAKERYDAALAAVLSRWEKTAEAVRRWREAADAPLPSPPLTPRECGQAASPEREGAPR